MSEKKKKLKYLLVINVIAIIGISCFLAWEYSNVYKECYVEAGVEISPKDFFKVSNGNESFVGGGQAVNTKVPGEYPVVLKKGWFSHNSILYVSDTIAPEAKSVELTLGYGDECDAMSLVSQITDATQVEAAFVEQPDFNKIGNQQVAVVLKDLGGNETILESSLTIVPVYGEILVEAGSQPPDVEAFVMEGFTAELVTDITECDYTVPAAIPVEIRVEELNFYSTMNIVDTIAPQVVTQDIQGFLNVPYKAEEFVVSVEDATQTTAKYVQEPDVSKEGEQALDICVVDAGGNQVVKSVKLTISKDTEAPELKGVEDLYVFIGDSVSYKKRVKVTDNCSYGLELNVDNDGVNLSVEGTYPITYVATDFAGNETSASCNVIVKKQDYSEDEVNALADKVLAKILNEDMTPYDKVQAIYNYTRRNIGYISHSEKGNWVRAAYEGLVDRQGDCYVYACTAKVLLTRAGITNMDIEKIPAKTKHYWNLVDIGEGWYHFDTTPRKDGTVFFMWNEEDLMKYSETHNLSHNYDHSIYPVVN